MATPTRAELEVQLQNIVNILEEGRKFSEVNTGGGLNNFVAMADALTQSMEGDNASGVLAGMESVRASLSSYLTGGTQMLDPHLADWARFLGITSTDSQSILTELYDDFISAPASVATRAFTFGTPTPDGGNVGDGTIIRLTVDENALDIENGTTEAKKATVSSDANSGTEKSQEVLTFEGATASPDDVESLGSGNVTTIPAAHPDSSLLLNAGFEQFSGAIDQPTDIPNWTSDVAVIGDGTDYEFLEGAANIYLPAFNDNDVRRSLEIKLTRTLTQKINVRRTQLSPGAAYYLRVAFNENSTATGTLTITMGSQTDSFTLTAAAGWQTFALPVDENLWFANFNEDDLEISITFTRTAGTLTIDDVIFVPFVPFDGTGYLVLPGQTPFLVDDEFTWTDSATESKIQRWLYRLYGRYLPHSATPTIADP
jgi:hypothetical protein